MLLQFQADVMHIKINGVTPVKNCRNNGESGAPLSAAGETRTHIFKSEIFMLSLGTKSFGSDF